MTDPTHNNPTEGEQIDAALALLSQEPLPTTTLPDPAPRPLTHCDGEFLGQD